MKRIEYLHAVAFPPRKANGLQVARMCNAFASSGYSVRLLVPVAEPDVDSGVLASILAELLGESILFEVRAIHVGRFFDSRIGRRCRQTVLGNRLLRIWFGLLAWFRVGRDITSMGAMEHVIYTRDLLSVWPLLFRKARVGLYFEAHEGLTALARVWPGVLKRIRGIVAVSGGIRDAYETVGYEKERILVEHDTVDEYRFGGLSCEQSRQRLELPQDARIVTYVGRFRTKGKEKGVFDLIDAAGELVSEVPRLLLLLVGAEEAEVAEYSGYTRTALGTAASIVTIWGLQAPQRVPQILASSDVLVIPFPYETHFAYYCSPLKLFEYMAAGKAIICSDLPALREIVSDDVNCLMFPPGDAHGLAASIGRVLRDSELAARLGEAAQREVRGRSWEGRAARIAGWIASGEAKLANGVRLRG